MRLSPIIVVLAIVISAAGAFLTPLTRALPNGVAGSVVVGAGIVEATFTLNVTQAPSLLYIPAPGNVTYCTAYEEGFGDLYAECGVGYVNVSVLEPGAVNVTYTSENATVERGALIITWVFLPVRSIVQVAGLVLVDFSGANATLVSTSELEAGPGNLTLYMTTNVSTSSVTTTSTTSTYSTTTSTTTTTPSTTTTSLTTTTTSSPPTTSSVTTSTTTTAPVTSTTSTSTISTTSTYTASSTTATTTTATTTASATETATSQTTLTTSTSTAPTSYTTSSSASSRTTTSTATSTTTTTMSTSPLHRAPALEGLYAVAVALAVAVTLIVVGLVRRGGRS